MAANLVGAKRELSLLWRTRHRPPSESEIPCFGRTPVAFLLILTVEQAETRLNSLFPTYKIQRSLIILFLIDNFVPPENDDGRLIKVEILQQPTRSFKCELTLDNVTFSNNLVTRLGMIYVNLKNGHLNMSLNNIATSENNHICSFGDCTELTVGGNIVAALLIELISQRSVEEPSV